MFACLGGWGEIKHGYTLSKWKRWSLFKLPGWNSVQVCETWFLLWGCTLRSAKLSHLFCEIYLLLPPPQRLPRNGSNCQGRPSDGGIARDVAAQMKLPFRKWYIL